MLRSTAILPGRRFGQGAIWASLTTLAIVLVSRRLAGAFSNELPGSVAGTAATLAVLLSLLAWRIDRFPAEAAMPFRGRLSMGLLTLLPPFLLGVSLLPGGSVTAAFYLWTLFLLTAAALLAGDEFLSNSKEQRAKSIEPEKALRTGASGSPLSALRSPLFIMTRTATEDGTERIEGRIQLRFAPGQQQTVAHLAFCPPLPTTPEVHCDVLDDSAVRLKVGTARSYGARIEARRSQETETALTVEIGYAAVSAATQADAA